MQFKTISIVSLLAALATASPLEARNPTDSCHLDKSTGLHKFTIALEDDRSIDADCGRGILDNVRGRCGAAVSEWGCDYNGDTGAIIHFTVAGTCSGGDVSAAIGAAGGPQLVCG